METNYYNRSNNFSAPIRKEPKPYIPKVSSADESVINEKPHKEANAEQKNKTSSLQNIKSDDLLILGLLLLLISDSSSDLLLILALGYLLLDSRN